MVEKDYTIPKTVPTDKGERLKEKTKSITIQVIMVIVIVVGIFALFDLAANFECDMLALRMGVNGDHSWIVGCFVEAEPNVWIPVENYCHSIRK